MTTNHNQHYTYKRLFALICCILTAILTSAAGHHRMTSKYLTVDDGLTSNKVYDIVQDPNGFLWMGTAYGLCRYDGYTFNNYYTLGYGDFSLQANMGNLFLDEENHLLWARNAMYEYACFDLDRNTFVNYAGENDIHKSYRRCFFSDSGFWMYDDHRIRQVVYQEGAFTCHDFSSEDGTLPTEKVIRLVKSASGTMWVITEKNVLSIDTDHQVKKIVDGTPVSRGCTWGDDTYFLTKDNRVLVFNKEGRRKNILTIPKELAKAGSQNGNFIWQDKWVIFTEKETLVMDFKTNSFATPPDCQLGGNAILLDEMEGNTCVASGGSLYIFPAKGNVKRLDLMTSLSITVGRNRKFTTILGKDGKFYIASYGNGLFIYDPKNDTTEHHLSTDERPVIDSNYLVDIMFDQSGCLWVSQEDAGVACLRTTPQAEEKFIQPEPSNPNVAANHIYMLYRQQDGTVMASTRGNSLYHVNMDTGQSTLEGTFKSSPIAYMKDRQGHTWIGTRNNGFFLDGQQFSRLDSVHHFPAVAVYDIAVDKKDRVWIATWEQGIFLTQYNDDYQLQFQQFLNSDMNENRINDIDIDKNGRMWIATYNGLYSIDTKKTNITSKDFIRYNTQNKLLPINEIHCMMVASDGALWIGGLGAGALRLDVTDVEHPVVEAFGTRQGLPNFNVYSFAEDKYGNIWIATEGKLARLSKKNGSIDAFRMGNNIQSNIFAQNCALRLNDGKLIFGTANGLAVINPDAVTDKNEDGHTAIVTGIDINGTTISQGEKWTSYFHNNQLSLKYNENTIKIFFSNFNYENIEAAKYQYYLEGYDKGWNEPTTVSNVEYGNLQPGTYIFHLRSASGGNADMSETTMPIHIHQPWWNTWWAWMLYIAAICGISYYIYKNWRERFNLHQQMKVDKQVNQFRIDFFTHVAHEFRTPLSIITGAADKMSDTSPQSISKKMVQTVKRGSKRLSQLVNQLMEFQKVNTDNFKLSVQEDDIVAFIRDIFQDFWNMAQQKQQNLTFTPFDKQYKVPFDKHIVDTVVYNLLSNAIKYTPEKGTITMKLGINQQQNQLIITVDDNGPGISKDRQEKLFHPFMEGEASPGGIGIGLYTSKKMAQTHKGDLTYEQTDNGSRFIFTLPSDAGLYHELDFKRSEAIDSKRKSERDTEPIIKELMPQAMNDHKVIIIEDDHDMLDMITSELSVYFNTTGYSDGTTGYEQVVKQQPSIVICDVSLGDTTGYEVVRKIKENQATTHIPVIMLTGHGGEDYQIKGYKAGADDYMVKPCNFHILIARMAQLIKWGEQAKAAYEQRQMQSDTNEATANDKQQTAGDTIITSRSDKMFLEKMNSIMQQHIDDPDFTMDQLAQLMNMGRTKFYGKAKELTGLSPNKYLLAERMKLAGELLYSGEYTVSEVCYKVGIQDLSYFNKCFKAAFGVTPSKYGK